MLFGFTAADPHDHCDGQRDFLLQLRFTDAGFADDDDPFPRPAQCGFEMRADCVDRKFTLRPLRLRRRLQCRPMAAFCAR